MPEWIERIVSTWDFGHIVMWIGGPGFAVWYAMHQTKVVAPRRDRQFLAEIGALRKNQEQIVEKFTEELRSQREEHHRLMREMREHHRQDLAAFWQELKAENKTRHDDTMRLIEVISELRERSKGQP